MDEITKLLPFLGGAFALAGGIFTFVNGRLNEAKTSEQRSRVVTLTLNLLSIAFSLCAFAAMFIPNAGLWFLLFFAISYAISLGVFLRQCGPTLRLAQVVFLCFTFSTFTGFVTTMISAYYIGRLVEVIHHQMDITDRLSKILMR